MTVFLDTFLRSCSWSSDSGNFWREANLFRIHRTNFEQIRSLYINLNVFAFFPRFYRGEVYLANSKGEAIYTGVSLRIHVIKLSNIWVMLLHETLSFSNWRVKSNLEASLCCCFGRKASDVSPTMIYVLRLYLLFAPSYIIHEIVPSRRFRGNIYRCCEVSW